MIDAPTVGHHLGETEAQVLTGGTNEEEARIEVQRDRETIAQIDMLIEAGTTIAHVIELVPMAGTLIEVALTGTLMVEGMTGTKAEMAMGDTKGRLENKVEDETARDSKRMMIVIVDNNRIGDTCHSRKLIRTREHISIL